MTPETAYLVALPGDRSLLQRSRGRMTPETP